MNVGAALLGGLAGTFAWLVLAYACHAAWPRRFTLNPLYLAGTSVTIETTAAYAVGATVALLAGGAYSLLVGALTYGFDATGAAWLVGTVAGLALTVISGTTVAYAELLHRGVRSGLIGAPGPIAVRHGRAGVAAMFGWHVVFGLVAGAVYGAIG